MQTGITHIRKELAGIYPEMEIEALTSIILQYVKSYSRTQLLLARNEILSDKELYSVEQIATRLKNHEPIQYILGETEFYGSKFLCRPGVLIPRQETEELVDWVLKKNSNQKINILDIGTGSGCIPISIKKQMPNAHVFACDISDISLQLARENAILNKADVSIFKMDILQRETDKKLPLFDVIISNPPYVRESEKTEMRNNVLNYEPELALFVPDNSPLIFYRSILMYAEKQLKSGGKLFWEINEALGDEYLQLLNEFKYLKIDIKKDINGKNRMILAQKP